MVKIEGVLPNNHFISIIRSVLSHANLIKFPHHVPILDGMRGLAIILVLLAHYGLGGIIPGGFGLFTFFVLSGYLITSLLINEADNHNGRVHINNFYIRRILRLAPALMLHIIGYNLILIFYLEKPQPWGLIFSTIFYYHNYYLLTFADSYHDFKVLWSLAVEEHFYLLFPIIFIKLYNKNPKLLLWLCLIIITLVACWRTIALLAGIISIDHAYIASDTRIDSIMFGALIALCLHTSVLGFNFHKFLSDNIWLTVVAALILVLTFVVQVDLFKYSIRYSLQGVALFILFPSVVYVRKFIFINKFISLGFWRWLGKISYSLYLWHVAVITVMGHMFCEELASCDISDQRPLLFYSLSLILALMISTASYHLVEEKFIKLRKRYR